ncbi:DUF2336 domain-containing protein [Bradyrhizobium sp. HKCCYLS1011]|uniref:DUF2336 domain-containing protein n=1 Tax=Bradyrhizobium sp. HKCCYLS1011 TaxID=3420733 RepID=UPI003EBA66B0
MSTKPARHTESLLDELETTLAHGTVARRVETLRRVTDLFVHNGLDFSQEQIVLFDDVFQCLIEHIEVSAKALLAQRLAPIDTAPPQTMRRLASDDAIEVAGPVLSKSERLPDDLLIETARTKSQAHLLAISLRRVLSRAVTDVLLLRGNEEVVRSTAANPGAEFSDGGFDHLADRAAQDAELAAGLALRPDLPRHLYLKLVTKASETVRQRLEAAHPDKANQISYAVQAGARRARSAPVAQTSQTEIAHALVRSLHQDGRLDGQLIEQFAEHQKFDEANAAVAALANVSVDVAETIMIEGHAEGVMILGKVAGLPWSTVKLLINMRDTLNGSTPLDLSASKATYERLRPSTAQQVLRFHRVQQLSVPPPERSSQ